jgi:PII-like signaling protein
MQGICLKLFVSEAQRYASELMYEWLLEQAKKMGIPGGTAFRATAGFGRHGKLHEETFFELAGELPVEIEFMVSEHQAEQIMQLLKANGLKLFYTKISAEYGVTS